MSFKIQEALLKQAYPRLKEKQAYYTQRIEHTARKLVEIYGEKTLKDIRFFSAPGRTEIGGNHTDHQRGCVLAAAVDMDILAAVCKNNLGRIRICSEGNPSEDIDLNSLSKKVVEQNTSSALIRGISYKISAMGYKLGGFDAYMTSDVLRGSGLSSSAAYEVIVGAIINALYCENRISPVEIAQIGQYAENVYFGKPSGLMDQMAASVGGAVAIDFKENENPKIQQVAIDLGKEGYALCIIDSGADHVDLTPAYAAIPKEMKSVANFFNKDYLRDVTKEMIVEHIGALRKCCGDRAVLRALHFLADNENAQKERECLKNGDFSLFLKTVKASGHSSFMQLQNVYVSGSTVHQEVALTLALCKEFLQEKGVCRVHGGGFAGTVQAFVQLNHLEGFRNNMERVLGKDTCHVLTIRPVGGIELLKEE